MNVGTAHSEVNPNTRVMNSRGIWLSYVLAIGLLHVVLLSIPFVSVPVVWTLTNLIHNMVRACLLPAQALGAVEGEEPPQPWARCQGDVLTTSVPGPQTQLSSQPPPNFWVPAVCTLRMKTCGSVHIPRTGWLVDLEGGPLGTELRAPESPQDPGAQPGTEMPLSQAQISSHFPLPPLRSRSPCLLACTLATKQGPSARPLLSRTGPDGHFCS